MGKNILIIDDEEFVRSVLVLGLETVLRGYNILSAKNGREAVKILDSVPVDLMVTDVNMPGMDGCELVTYTRTTKPDMPVLAMTGDYNAEVRSRLLSLGVSKCFEKPFNFRELAAWILSMLRPDLPSYPMAVIPLTG